jgi:Na+/H+ antiporter NhaD/arsenite permease-like protein
MGGIGRNHAGKFNPIWNPNLESSRAIFRQTSCIRPFGFDRQISHRTMASMTLMDYLIMLPFLLLLGSMAVGPVFAPEWWLKHYAKVALGLGAFVAGWYLLVMRDAHSLWDAAHEYISFIALVGSLFVISGGIHIGIKGRSTPLKNVVFLFAGALLANILGTTGAGMLLIRPWIRMNQSRITAYHIVFFIFIVANVGGSLTPIGDPPLFLGFLLGIPFWWVAQNCWPMWLVGVGLLLTLFYLVDRRNFSRTLPMAQGEQAGEGKWLFMGLPNLFFLAVILGAVFIEKPLFLREGLMLAAAAGSYFTTRKNVHAANSFNFHPIQEVAILFAGIFTTMIPALDWLKHESQALLGAEPAPGVFFWGTGVLSSALDNAPTYLGFLTALHSTSGITDVPGLIATHNIHLQAISIAAVFFGAATYIGNGPNFMVKAIAEDAGVRMPSFLEYVAKFTLPFLLPVLVLVWLVFFRG